MLFSRNSTPVTKARVIATYIIAVYLLVKIVLKNVELQPYDYVLLIVMHISIFYSIYLKIKAIKRKSK